MTGKERVYNTFEGKRLKIILFLILIFQKNQHMIL